MISHLCQDLHPGCLETIPDLTTIGTPGGGGDGSTEIVALKWKD